MNTTLKPLRRQAASIASRLPRQGPGSGLDVEVVAATGSTNADLLAMPVTLRHGKVLLALCQTAGRGRHGRSWHSPHGGGIFLSLAWNFARPDFSVGLLPIAAGIGCARGLRHHGVAGIAIKWPNDLQVGNRKLGGILLESSITGEGGLSVVIGVGINLDLGDLDAASTSLGRPVIDLASLRGRSLDVEMRGALVARLLVEIVAAWETLVADGADSLLQDWPAFDCLGGKEVQATVYGRAVVGIARGISAEGALLLDLSRTAAEGGDRTNRVEVTAGEVTRLLPLR